jgi:hypothetical protein
MATNQPKHTERAGYLSNQADDGARTGIQAERGRPQAEHGQYGLVREKSPQAEGLTERQIRGLEATPDQPGLPEPSPGLPPQPGHIDNPQHPLPGNPPVMPQPTPPETTPHPGL